MLRLRVLDDLLDTAAPEILKIVDLSALNIEKDQKRDHQNNITTRLLNQLFGGVWAHSIYPRCRYDLQCILS